MMQVSTLYAHSLERQLVSRQSQKIIQNISRSCVTDQQNAQPALGAQPIRFDALYYNGEAELTEAGILPPELQRSQSCPAGGANVECSVDLSSLSCGNAAHNNNNNVLRPENTKHGFESDSKEFTDRLCKLPSQCKGGYILGSPRRHHSMNSSLRLSATRLSQSAGHLNVASHMSLVKGNCSPKSVSSEPRRGSMDGRIPSMDCNTPKDKKYKEKEDKKIAKKLPSNFMYLGTWTTRQNSEKLLEQVKSGDVLEFNITFHHHWGIAIVHKNKKPSLDNLDLIHLKKDKDGHQRVTKQTLADYWIQGVTARINNSRDVHKHPASAADVVSTSLKLTSQPYRIWQNSEQLITYCRYGEGVRSRQLSDAARWGSLSKCVGLWLSLTTSRQNSPSTSPKVTRKRTCSVTF